MNFTLQDFVDIVKIYAPKVVMAVLTLVIGLWIIAWITGLFRKSLKRREVDLMLQPFLVSLVSVGLKVLLLISVAGTFGIETTSFIAIFSALAFAVGLALQGTLGHFASGILLLTLRPYEVDQFVEVGGREGTVKGIQIFHTELHTPDGKKIVVPNGAVMSNAIVNYSAIGMRRLDIKLGIGYDDDIDQARQIVMNLMENKPEIMKDKPFEVYVTGHGDSAVNLWARGWTTTADFWDVNFYLWEQIKKDFDQAGIGIPYPQMDVHFPGAKPEIIKEQSNMG